MTSSMVLGLLLKFGSMSGYEIQQKMKSAQTDIWASVKPASIYHALRKLDKNNHVELKTIEHTGNRAKAIYSITEKGKKEFNNLLLNSFKNTSVNFPNALYTILTFVDEIDPVKLIKSLKSHRSEIDGIYSIMKEGQGKKEKIMTIPENVMYIFEDMYLHCEHQLKFIDKILDYLINK